MKNNEKTTFVREIFSAVADKYDLMNDLMSFGLHRVWKRRLVDQVFIFDDVKILDSAAGTGDVAHAIVERYGVPEITLCDINPQMLAQAKNRFINANILNANFVCASAEDLPFENDMFDYYTIAFGIRNVTDIYKSLYEAHRVIKPGGRFLCLEFGHVENKYIASLYDFYSFKLIPLIGDLVTKNKKAYEYLINSIRSFLLKEEFIIMMHQVGFTNISCKSFSNGIVNLYSCQKNLEE